RAVAPPHPGASAGSEAVDPHRAARPVPRPARHRLGGGAAGGGGGVGRRGVAAAVPASGSRWIVRTGGGGGILPRRGSAGRGSARRLRGEDRRGAVRGAPGGR